MKLTFLGAAHEVTGSCYYLEVCGKHILIDCGMEQGPDEYQNQDIPIDPHLIDYIFLTHAHIDHSGRIPLLYKNGFRGIIYTTVATKDLCNIMLRDSAHIQEFEAEWRNRKAKRSGKPPFIPLYTMEDAVGVMEHFKGYSYGNMISIQTGISIRFVDVGHLLGSASIEIWLEEEGVKKKIVFSGDIGNLNQPLIRDPQYIAEADYVVMESTYGDRSHGEVPDFIAELSRIIQSTFDRGGNVVIPSFAVGRTQELLYFLRKIKADHLVTGYGEFPVYVDSPLAIEATNIFHENRCAYFDEEALSLIYQGINPISFIGLKTSITSDDSKAINIDSIPKVIISASGMCEAGRIKHHLKHNIWRPESTILFVGYQAHGTLGRAILEGATTVKLFGEQIDVKAQIIQLNGISGHADNNGLIRWIQEFKNPQRVFVTHGEDSICDLFTKRLQEEYNLVATSPYPGSQYDLIQDVCIKEGTTLKIQKRDVKKQHTSPAFDSLLSSGNRLMHVINSNSQGTNKDLELFRKELEQLIHRWNRES